MSSKLPRAARLCARIADDPPKVGIILSASRSRSRGKSLGTAQRIKIKMRIKSR